MTELVIVPHTHWDREWYLPFQRFRLRLVTVLDGLLKQLADDPRLCFTLDGQTAALDDYLEIRPEQDGLVRELVQQGQLAIGPWRVLADSFLCSGENLLRNLEIGMRRAADLGGVMRVGYLPDQFGHCAQLPQLLRISGIEDACVWRGVGSEVRTTSFRWVAPDGTWVRAQYLPEGGYGGAAGIFADPDPTAVERRAVEHARALRNWQQTGPLLGMYGTDHSAPVDDLADIVSAASRLAAWEDTVHPDGDAAGGPPAETLVDFLLGAQNNSDRIADHADESPRARLRLDTLAGYFATLRALAGTKEAEDPYRFGSGDARRVSGPGDTEAVITDAADSAEPGQAVVRGELRSHARANILPGVLSARIPLKQALSHAERLVERYAEPLTALYGMPFATQPFLNLAWLRLVDSSCHDSVTGCGVDETAAQVATRIAEAADLARGVCELVLAPIAGTVPDGGHLVFNPSPRRRTEVVFLDAVQSRPLGVPTQLLTTEQPMFSDALVPADEVDRFLRRVHGRELYGQQITAWQADADEKTLTFHLAQTSELSFDVAEVRAVVDRAEMWRIRVLTQARQSVAALVECGPLALAAVTPAGPAATGSAADEPVLALPAAAEPAAIASGRGSLSDLDNGLVHAALRTDGLLDLLAADGTHVSGLGAVVDGGDLGDEYNYAPPARDRIVTAADEIWNRVLWSGPLTGCLESVRWYSWPRRGAFDLDARSEETLLTEVTTRVELRHGEPFVRLTVAFDNSCDDHRVRLHFPLPRPAAHSSAEGQFAVVDRGLTAEGGGGEHPLPTFPAYGWVAAGGLAVLLDHVSEYELVDEGRTLALTLLRSVGMLSRNRNAHREEPAGPQRETPGAQCHGLRTVELALYLYAGEWHESGLLDAAERFHHPFRTEPGWNADPEHRPAVPAGGVEVVGDGVVLSSCRDIGHDGPELRLVALTPHPATAVVHSRHGHGEIALRPWQIVSITARGAAE